MKINGQAYEAKFLSIELDDGRVIVIDDTRDSSADVWIGISPAEPEVDLTELTTITNDQTGAVEHSLYRIENYADADATPIHAAIADIRETLGLS